MHVKPIYPVLDIMTSLRIQLSQQEKSYYETLFNLAGPDITGHIPGGTGAQFLSTSKLSRDVLHKIWALSDIHQQGKLNKEDFFVACRLVAHAQSSAAAPEPALVNREPSMLPIFEGLKKPSNSMSREVDVISLSDHGNESNAFFVDPSKASNIALSLSRLGMDPLEFIPFQSGPEIAASQSNASSDWKLPEVSRQKYTGLFKKLDKESKGVIDGKTARAVLEKSGLSRNVLGVIWELSDLNSDGILNLKEFLIAMHLTTKCKKGFPLPADVPSELLDQLNHDEIPSILHKEHKPTIDAPPETWKYSRTYLDSAIEEEKRLKKDLNGEVDESEEEMRYIFDLCAQVESDSARMEIELDKKKTLLSELDRSKKELQERKLAVTEMRKNLNIDKISLNRDRTKLQSEIIHLKKLLAENSQDVEILRNSVQETQADLERTVQQTLTLDAQRREAVRQHTEEVSKIESEQRETAELVESWNRLGREEEVKLESEKIRNEKNRIIEEMQRNPQMDSRITGTSAFADKSNKWATTILQQPSPVKPRANIGFGTTFFQQH